MPNQITAAGLEVKTYTELLTDFISVFQTIYGADINLNADTPDGQLMNIFIQICLDYQDLLVQVNSGFDPSQAFGKTLDQRCAINGVIRKGGTYTVTPITIVTSQALNLYGRDQTDQPIYTVSDNAGNQFELLVTTSIPSASSNVLSFRAKTPGEVLTVPNTIVNPVTIVLGINSINNPTTYTTLGINEETDSQLKIRRQKAVAQGSQGYAAGLYAALTNINGIDNAFIYENRTGTTDGDGVEGHSIWVIVDGSASAAQIANAIFTKRNEGCGMHGDETFNIVQVDGNIITIRWDFVENESIFAKFTLTSLDGVTPPNIAGIRAGIPGNYIPAVYEKVNVNTLADRARDIDSNVVVTSAGFSTTSGGSYTSTLLPSAKDKQFRFESDNIIILPMILNPVTSTVVNTVGTVAFAALGGYGAIVYTVDVDNSGAAIDGATGAYTAGATPGTDTIKATDSLGNFATATVVVT